MFYSALAAILQETAPPTSNGAGTVRLIAGILALVLVVIIIMRRKSGKKKEEEEF